MGTLFLGFGETASSEAEHTQTRIMTFFHRFSNILIECLEDLFYRWAVNTIMTLYMRTVFADGGSWSRGTHTPSSWPPSQPPSSVPSASLSSGTIMSSSLHLSCLVTTHLNSHVTVTLLRDLLLAVVFWCTWCSLRCSHWTLLLSRIEHKANLLWIPADSDYNTKQVWKTLISFRDGLVTHQKKDDKMTYLYGYHDILNEIWTMFDISFHIVSGLARPTFWVTVKRRNYVIFQWKYFNSWVNRRNV